MTKAQASDSKVAVVTGRSRGPGLTTNPDSFSWKATDLTELDTPRVFMTEAVPTFASGHEPPPQRDDHESHPSMRFAGIAAWRCTRLPKGKR